MPSTHLRLAAACASLTVLLAGCTGSGDSPEPTDRVGLSARELSAAAGESGSATSGPLPVRTGWGPTAAEIAQARKLVGGLTLEQRAGQVIVAHYHGTAPPAALVNRLHLGGVIVFDQNIRSLDQLRASNQAVQRSAAKAGRKWPVFVGVDQEGGLVERVQQEMTRFPAFMTAGAARSPRLTRAAAQASGAELAGLGFTVDFAPDRDVTAGPSDPTIGSRSASSDPAAVTRQADAASRGFAAAGLVPVAKHFPGHGSVAANSHVTLPVQHKSLRQLRRTDLVPFADAVADAAPAVMVGHLDIRAVDPGVPSSLSHDVVTGLLREDLGFEGLAVTDALNMGAITRSHGSADAAVRALRAGEDVLLMPKDPAKARDGIVAAVRHGRLDPARLDQAAIRQVALLLHQRHAGTHPARPGSGRAASHALSAAGITVAQGPCRGRLVGPKVKVTGDPDDVAGFRVAARAGGLKVARKGTTVRLVRYGGGKARGDVVVALDTPYVLGPSRARVKVATYGDTPGAMQALVDVLTGKAEAPGRLPVPVPGVPRTGC